MYSVVLMTALTAGGANAPEHLFSRGCHGCVGYSRGCHGCVGYSRGCHGGWGCHGSWGCHGGWGCHGCSGSYGYMGGHGCSGSYGCMGGYGCAGSYGCVGSYGGGYGCYSGGYGGYGCYSGCYGCHGGYNSCYGCAGCHGCTGMYGYSPYHVTPHMGTPVYGAPVEGTTTPPPVEGEKTGAAKVRSQLLVELPEDAKLFVDGVEMKTTSAKRVFVTPGLDKNQTYFYDLKAEFQREGQVVNVTGRVVINPGQDVAVSLSEPSNKGTFVVSAR